LIQTVEIVKVRLGAAVVDPGNAAALAEAFAHRAGRTRLLLG